MIVGISNLAFAAEDDAVTVTVSEVITEELAPVVHSAGTVFSRNETLITAGLAGRLTWVAEPGDFVDKGEAVARFDILLADYEIERPKMLILKVAERVELSVRASLILADVEPTP